jgi:hypothetical protein
MGVHYDGQRRRWVVRWVQDGRKRIRRFVGEAEAREFAASVSPRPLRAPWTDGAKGDGVYAYETRDGTRYRFLFRHSDGALSTRRGFMSRRAAVTARRRLVESIERGEVKPARETFGEFWARYLEERRPYLTSGTLIDYKTHGRKRLLPTFGSTPLVRIDEAAVRRWLRALTADVEAAGLSPQDGQQRADLPDGRLERGGSAGTDRS